MLQVHRDMICSKCQSVNEHEQITRVKNEFETLMIIRCKSCGHEHEQGSIAYWSDGGLPIDFTVTDWVSQVPETY